jgi:TonB-dependent SusC/RagA subfamily outer membrane receptor
MKAPTMSRPVSYTPAFVGALAFLILGACATTRSVQEESPAEPEKADGRFGIAPGDNATTLRRDDREVGRSRTLAEMLARLPGVTVSELSGGALRVRVVGSSSILAGEDPLFVVDGMAVQPDALGSLNPSDIESITVLKNPQETAVYGSRGANGVILIKTRQGPR